MQFEIAAKLRLSAIALGCANRKEFCARFRAANPKTTCELERLHKWLQGRALPRSGQFYDDWAKVLGSQRPGHWLAGCTISEFRTELARLTGLAESDLPRPDTPRERPAAPDAPPPIVGGAAMLCGAFACYSQAWSPHYRGRLVRSALRIRPGPRAGLRATYSEMLLGRPVHMPAEVRIRGQILHLIAQEPNAGLPAFLSLILPGPPASVLCGIMSGAAFLAHQPLPSATRILMVRVPDGPGLDSGNRYMEHGRPAIAADLCALGLPVPEARRMDELAAAFLGTPADQVSPDDQSDFAALLDAHHLMPEPA